MARRSLPDCFRAARFFACLVPVLIAMCASFYGCLCVLVLQLFKPWTGWQSRWSRPPLTLWRPRLVQNLTNERKLLQKETMEDIADYQHYQREKMEAQQAAEPAAPVQQAQTPKEKPAKESKFKTIKKRQRA
jgi:hypothetical protein